MLPHNSASLRSDLPAHVIEQAAGTSICAGIHADDGISCCL